MALSASRAVCLHAAAEKKAGSLTGFAFAAEAFNFSLVFTFFEGFKPKPNRKRCQASDGMSKSSNSESGSHGTMCKQMQGLADKV